MGRVASDATFPRIAISAPQGMPVGLIAGFASAGGLTAGALAVIFAGLERADDG
jgi:hypothetical protein